MKLFRSMRYTIVAIVGLMALLVCGAVIGYNWYILKLSEERTADTVEETLRLYVRELDSYIETAENYLLSKSLVDEQKMRLKNPQSDLELYLAEITIKNDLGETIVNYKLPDGIFVYDQEHDIYLDGLRENGVSQDASYIQENRDQILEEFRKAGYGRWYFVRLGEAYYLLRTFVNGEIYTTGWMNIEPILKELREICMEEGEYLRITDKDDSLIFTDYSGELPKSKKTGELTIEGTRYWLVRGTSEFGFSIELYKRLEALSGAANPFRAGIAAAALFILALILAVVFLLNETFMKPLNRLAHAMQRLKQGDFEVKLAGTNDFEEFQMVNETFDAMTEEIEELKIHIYEEKLQKQTAELQYLQIQVNPHFLTNCLNLIRNLSILDQKEEVEEATFLLSKYIRYTLNSKTTVSIRQELEHVEDYVKLQKMRYADQLRLKLQVNETLYEEAVPCMMIQTFVENAVKHQLAPDEELQIMVRVSRVERQYGIPNLYIAVLDSGEGFDEEILEQLRDHQVICKKDGEHIGIYNVVQRLSLLYGDRAHILFGNREQGGALVEVYIPMEVKPV